MERSEKNRHSDLALDMPCCGGRSSLDSLDYRAPCAIAMFRIQLGEGPGRATEEVLRRAGEILGTEMKTVEAVYGGN